MVEATKLVEQGCWEKVSSSDPVPLYPNSADAEGIEVVIFLYRVRQRMETILSPGTDAANVAEFYDKWAVSYEKDVLDWGYDLPERVATLILKHHGAPNEASVLDAGAGDGLTGQALQKAGFKDLTGIDISSKFLAKADGKGIYRKTEVMDLSEPLKFSGQQFDVCTCTGVLIYLEPACGVLSEFVRVTKPGGLVCFTVRTDKLDEWRLESEKMVGEGSWEKIADLQPVAILPRCPDGGDQKVVIFLYSVSSGGSQQSKRAKTDA